MTKGINQKQKMLYLEKIFQEEPMMTTVSPCSRLRNGSRNTGSMRTGRPCTAILTNCGTSVWTSSVPTADGTAPTTWANGNSNWPN